MDTVTRFPERAADLLINEILRSIETPFILVLDDYHHIGPKTLVHKIVDRVLQYASEHLHLIITTRDLPPLARNPLCPARSICPKTRVENCGGTVFIHKLCWI